MLVMNFNVIFCLCVVMLQIESSGAQLFAKCSKDNGWRCKGWSPSKICELNLNYHCKNSCWPDVTSCCDCTKRPKKKCFPSTSKVKLANGKSVKMSELQLGDQVQTVSQQGYISYSEVRTFLMKEPSVINMYKSFTTSKNTTITLTENHLIYVKNRNADQFYPIYADQVLIGNNVLVHENNQMTSAKVINISSFKAQGAYVPLTKEGNIVVDRVLASCYASFDHDLAHIAMAPIQWFPEIIEWLYGEEEASPDFVDIAKIIGKMILPYGSII